MTAYFIKVFLKALSINYLIYLPIKTNEINFTFSLLDVELFLDLSSFIIFSVCIPI